MFVNKRKFFRVELPDSLEAYVTIVKMKDKDIVSKSTVVMIDNIGPGGLKFITSLDLPVSNQVVLQFELKILNKAIKLLGYTVRKSPQSVGQYEYGVTFTIDEIKQANLTMLCNELVIRDRKKAKAVREDSVH